MSADRLVLVSWIAILRDPYERDEKGNIRLEGGEKVLGPTLALLTDPASDLAGKVTDAVFLRQGGKGSERRERIWNDLEAALAERCPTLQLHTRVWDTEDPTDHMGIFHYLREQMPQIRRQFQRRELVVHVSPGTPSMHTIWVLMAETGFIDRPFRVVKSVERAHRRDGRAVVPVSLGIDTFYKRYQETRPGAGQGAEQSVRWDPARFRSDKLKALYRDARRVARLKVPVLLLGERGTGKTTLAGWIRANSPYHRPEIDSAWPAVACGQFASSEMMQSELFGHVRGAFTGAVGERRGLLHRADRDTLFLDEIGDVSRDMQRLMIKAIEEHTYQALGSNELEHSDFRLISATNLPLHRLSEKLDADFYDRISACALRVPALREIPEDLGWLWDATLVEAARRACVSTQYARLSEKERGRLIGILEKHPLPGNMRDLFRVAWRFLAARADDDEPLPPSDALNEALRVLDTPDGTGGGQAQTIARCFAENLPLPASILNEGPIQSSSLVEDLHAYLASEVSRLRKDTRRPHEEVIDVTDRGVRKWARNKSSGEAER